MCVSLLQLGGAGAGNQKSPMQFVKEAPLIKVHGSTVASYGSAPILALLLYYPCLHSKASMLLLKKRASQDKALTFEQIYYAVWLVP